MKYFMSSSACDRRAHKHTHNKRQPRDTSTPGENDTRARTGGTARRHEHWQPRTHLVDRQVLQHGRRQVAGDGFTVEAVLQRNQQCVVLPRQRNELATRVRVLRTLATELQKHYAALKTRIGDGSHRRTHAINGGVHGSTQEVVPTKRRTRQQTPSEGVTAHSTASPPHATTTQLMKAKNDTHRRLVVGAVDVVSLGEGASGRVSVVQHLGEPLRGCTQLRFWVLLNVHFPCTSTSGTMRNCRQRKR